MDKLALPAAYKFVAVAIMLAEINHCASRLNLPCKLPITRDQLRTEHVAKPLITGFGGTFETEDFTFIFFKSGILRQISRHNSIFGDMPLRDLQWKLHAMKSLISTNE